MQWWYCVGIGIYIIVSSFIVVVLWYSGSIKWYTVKNGVFIYLGCRYIYYKRVYIPIVRCSN